VGPIVGDFLEPEDQLFEKRLKIHALQGYSPTPNCYSRKKRGVN